MSDRLFIHKPRQEGQFRVHCGCGQITESDNVFNPDSMEIEKHIFEFLNAHTAMGHSGVYEAWYHGQWVIGAPFSPVTAEDAALFEKMGGLR